MEEVNLVTMAALLQQMDVLFQRAKGKGYVNLVTLLKQTEQNSEYKDLLVSILSANDLDTLKGCTEQENMAYLINEADNIAYGCDKREGKSNEDVINHNKQPLYTIFNLLNGVSEKEYVYETSYLYCEEEIPIPIELNVLDKAKNFEKYNHVQQQFQKFLEEQFCYTGQSVYQFLQRYTSYIPATSYVGEKSYISFYEHSKLTAAIASSMHLYLKDKGITQYKQYLYDSPSAFRKMDAFVLASADISGVQDFIYTIASKGAMKSLRARSFYLEMLFEYIADTILDKLNLSRANILYTGGGHFYMLLPNIAHTQQVLLDVKNKVNDWFIELFGTRLYIEIGSVKASASQLMNMTENGNKGEYLTGELFRELSSLMAKGKVHRYSKEQLSKLFTPKANVEHDRECSVCHTSSRAVKSYDQFEIENICDNCFNLFKLGAQLSKIDSGGIVFGIATVKDEHAFQVQLPTIDGPAYLEVCEVTKLSKMKGYNKIYSINQYCDFADTVLLIGNYNKQIETEGLIEFKQLSNLSTGINRIGVLRADIDNLGQTFISGFSDKTVKNASISAFSELSKQLSLFFKYYINAICRGEVQRYKKLQLSSTIQKAMDLVIVYSGGDDVFVVGAWEDTLEFAALLRGIFRHFTCDKLTFSAGVSMFNESFPVYSMAQITGELESTAKDNEGKDSIALFGIDAELSDIEATIACRNVYKWSEFTNGVYGQKYLKLNEWFYFKEESKHKDKLFAPMGFLYSIYNMINHCEDTINVARLVYALARREPSKNEIKNNPMLEKVYNALRVELYEWAKCPEDRKELSTAILLIVYLNRAKGEIA